MLPHQFDRFKRRGLGPHGDRVAVHHLGNGDVAVGTAEHFVEKYCSLYQIDARSLSDTLVERFEAYDWPGNVRELENMVQRGVLLSAERNTIEENDVFDDFFTDAGAVASSDNGAADAKLSTIDDMERYMILQALTDSNNNQQAAADKLGISARTIRNKMRKYREEGHID